MKLFKKSSDEKFEEEKKKRIAVQVIKLYRDEKLNIPHTKYSRIILDECDKIDPERKMSERELLDKLFQSDEVKKALIEAGNEDSLISDDAIRTYVDQYYAILREVITSPDPNAWDAYEYQSQQLISVLTLKKVDVFRDYLIKNMDEDPTCPYFIKKTLLANLMSPRIIPTEQDEKTAEEIMGMVCPDLKKHNPEVFRALVDSLKWRGTEELAKTLENVKNTPKEKRHLRGRESCVFIETEERVHYVG